MKKNKDDSRKPPHFERGSDAQSAHDAARITLTLISIVGHHNSKNFYLKIVATRFLAETILY
jgi:hypothetical protein